MSTKKTVGKGELTLKVLALIPARMGSSRFPGKPMAQINGAPMIEHVFRNVASSSFLAETAVATCDEEIAQHIRALGGLAIMTSSEHERASDRCAEALLKLEDERGERFDIVVMVQGDEPMTHPNMIGEAIKPMLEDPTIKVVNLMSEIESVEEFNNPNCIKVVLDINGNALYFSRSAIPFVQGGDKSQRWKQVCVIPFARDYLLEYTSLAPTPLEISESVDMMRVLEHGGHVKMVPTAHFSHAVDTPADLEKVKKLMRTRGG